MGNLTQGETEYAATGVPDTFSVLSDGPTGNDGLAEQINGLYQAVTDIQTLLGSALTLKGTVADLVTRLGLVIGPDGALPKGTGFPGSPIDGQPFYRTDLDLVYIYDATSTTWKPGFDNPAFALLDGTRDFVGDIKIKKTVPSLRLTGIEASAADYKIGETAGALTSWKNTGTEGVPIWTEDNFFCPTGSRMLFDGSVCPNGWLERNGQAVSRTDYARLFGVIGTTYGAGDGSTTFNVGNGSGRVGIAAGAGTKVFTISAIDTGTEQLTVPSNTSLYTGQPVLYLAPAGAATGLTHNTTYYAIRVSATIVKLATSAANAFAGTAINLTSGGTGTQTLTVTLTVRTAGEFGGSEDAVAQHTHVITDPGHGHTISGRSASGTGGGVIHPLTSDNDGSGTAAGPTNSGGANSNTTGISLSSPGDSGGTNMMPFDVSGMWIIKT